MIQVVGRKKRIVYKRRDKLDGIDGERHEAQQTSEKYVPSVVFHPVKFWDGASVGREPVKIYFMAHRTHGSN